MSAPARTPAPTVAPFRNAVVEQQGWHLRIRQLPLAACNTTRLLQELRAFRAEVLYAGGRRPEFRNRAGEYVDAQLLDFGAYHITAHATATAPPGGYVRLVPPALTSQFQTRALLGPERFRALLDAHQASEDDVYEPSRLVVAEHARGLGLGAVLNAAALAAAQALGAAGVVAICGMDDGQHRFHQRFGYRLLPGTEHYDTHYEDHVSAMAHWTGDPNGEYHDLVHQIHRSITAKAAC
ncbi:GNAT family N-acetyltransferase [Polymorphospora rubra]|uniref:GNAT family N-acetyltransferase n=1 Tax=Polymorphospora rubra TaxID=338584 RepID=UPI0033D734B5